MGNKDFLSALLTHLKRVTGPDPRGWYTATCPFHDDRNPSLRLTAQGFQCLGCNEHGNLNKLAARLGVNSVISRRAGRRIAAIYDYKDENQGLLFQVIRHEPKGFRQRRPDGKGGWIWNLKDVTRVLYRLPELLATPADTGVFIPEGEKDVEALRSIGMVATCNPGGAGKFTPDLKGPLQGRTVVIIADKDKPGRRHAQQVAALLYGFAARIRVIEFPGDDIKDAADWVTAGGTPEELEKLAAEFPEWKPGQSPGDDEFAKSQLPVIIVNGRHLRDIAADTWDALGRANQPPNLFQRGHLLVDIILDDQGQPTLRTLDKPALKGIMDRVADFMVLGDESLTPARPPGDVVADMMAAKELLLPALHGVIAAPVLAPPGIIVTTSGYQQETRFYLNLEKGLFIPPVPDSPDALIVAQARSLLLDDLLVDFPFVSQADRAHAAALLLQPFVRPLIDGPTPLWLIESPTPGSGKGLLVVVLTIPAAGRGPAVMAEGRDEDEWRKRITSKLLQGPQFILIDNIRARLDSAALSAALTSEMWEDRILGHSRTAQLPVTCTWLATANNPALSLEVARRTVSIRLDPSVEKPWLRNGFKHPKLRLWARENRGKLIWAALTLIQAWIAAGKPASEKSLGSYESWSEVMGGILKVADIPSFLDNMDRVYAEADQESLAWSEFCRAWCEEFQDRLVASDLLLGLATQKSLLVNLWGGRNDQGARVRFGKALSKMKDRVIGSFRIRWAGEDGRNKVQTYRLERVFSNASTPRSAGDAGDCGDFPPLKNRMSKKVNIQW